MRTRRALALLTCTLALLSAVALGDAERRTAAPPGAARNHHVAPNAASAGDGTVRRPWTLAAALARPAAVRPGDTVWLHGGTYRGTFVSRLTGAPGRPVVVRQAPGERATIDGTLRILGAHATYWGFEVTNSDPVRTSAEADAEDPEHLRPTGIDVRGADTRLVNLVVHDAGDGIGFWTAARDAEVYGSLLYYNGWQGPVRGNGHGLYVQNAAGTKRIVDNVVFHQFGSGIHAFGSDAADVSGLYLEGNVAFENGSLDATEPGWDILVGGGRSAARIVARRNYTYRRDGFVTARFGYHPHLANDDLALVGNHFVGQTHAIAWRRLTVTGNTFTGAQNLVEVRTPPGVPLSAYAWRDNAYVADPTIATHGGREPFVVTEGRGRGGDASFAAWRARSGLDAGSRFQRRRPRGTTVVVRPNRYEAGRAHVVVYNWDRAPSVRVDLSAVLRPGDRYEIRDAQDYFGPPVVRATYRGAHLTVPLLGGFDVPLPRRSAHVELPMRARRPAAPVGRVPVAPPVTAPEFGVYVVVRR